MREAERRASALPGVEAIAITCCLPLQEASICRSRLKEFRPPRGPYNGDVQWRNVSAQYFQVFRIPLLRGTDIHRT